MDRVDIYYALVYGGVDNWEWYGDVMEMVEEQGLEWENLSEEERLDFLEGAGVDNWWGYDASIEAYEESMEMEDNS